MSLPLQLFLVAVIAFLGAFTQSVAGFGIALVAVPLLTELLGVRTAVPLTTMFGYTTVLMMLVRYRNDLNLSAVWRLILAGLVGLVIGVRLLSILDEEIIKRVMGAVLVGYSIYTLVGLTLPTLKKRSWAFGFGFLGGFLSGTTGAGGPPIVIYGGISQWEMAEFKANMQTYFIVSGLMLLSAHFLEGNINGWVLRNYVFGVGGVVLGLIAGFSMDRVISPQAFRKIVLVLLIVIGLRLLF